jgi:AraC-like DNA-binding protein
MLPERCLYTCYARSTGFHAVPIPKIFAPIEGNLSLEAEEWTAHLKSGENIHLPAKDDRLAGVVDWTHRTTRTSLLPGQLTIVKSNYSHRLIGNGKIAMLYLPLESTEGQGLLARDDYEIGITVTAPPQSEMSNVLRQLSLLSEKRWREAREVATEVFNNITAKVMPTANSPQIVPGLLVSVARGVRNRCRLKRYQCERNARIRLSDLVRYIGRTVKELEKITPKKLEEIFRKHFKTRVCSYVRFLHAAAVMQYCATEQRRAWREEEDTKIVMTELAAKFHYLDPSQFTRDFQGFHGIAPVMFFPNTYFILIDMEAD